MGQRLHVNPGFPKVSDEDNRDSLYPTPTDGFQVFNERTNNIETYYSDYELWLSSDMKVCIIDTAIVVNRIIYSNSFFTVSGTEYPIVNYPINQTQSERVLGVIQQLGKDIDGTRRFVAVAYDNVYFIEFAEAIAAGEQIYPRIGAGPNEDIGMANGSTAPFAGDCGIAMQNSGATTGKGTLVLVKISLTSEAY